MPTPLPHQEQFFKFNPRTRMIPDKPLWYCQIITYVVQYTGFFFAQIGASSSMAKRKLFLSPLDVVVWHFAVVQFGRWCWRFGLLCAGGVLKKVIHATRTMEPSKTSRKGWSHWRLHIKHVRSLSYSHTTHAETCAQIFIYMYLGMCAFLWTAWPRTTDSFF